MPALLHGPRWTPLPSPAPYPLPSTLSRFRSDCESGTLSTIQPVIKKPEDICQRSVYVFFFNDVPFSSYFIIARLTGMNCDAKEEIKYRAGKEHRSEEPFCGSRWVDRRLWRNPMENLRDLGPPLSNPMRLSERTRVAHRIALCLGEF